MRCRSPLRFWLPLLSCFFAFPARAYAHMTAPGMGDFVSGLLHPLTTLPHVLLIIGLGLLVGRQSEQSQRAGLWTFAPLSAIALAFTATGWVKAVYPPVLICLALCFGALLVVEVMPSVPVICALCAAAALGLGLDSGFETDIGFKQLKVLLGTWVSLNVLIFDIAIYVSSVAGRSWLKIALRIAGAWLIAISLMVLAFSLRK